MIKTAKEIAEKLNQTLDELGLPNNIRERSSLLSKMIDIPKQQAWSLLEGQSLPEGELIEKIATELEIEKEWLISTQG